MAAAVVTVVVLGAIGYLVPLAAAPEAVAAMSGDSAVRVETSPTRIVLTPAAAPKAGLVFLPGAKVDPRAYVPLLTEVSAAGYLVVIVKEPYDIGLLATGEPAKIVAATPGVTRWAVGGHSLGGVAAGISVSARDSGLSGLLLWAVIPARITGRPDRPRRRLRLRDGRRPEHACRHRRQPGQPAAVDGVHRGGGRHPRVLR